MVLSFCSGLIVGNLLDQVMSVGERDKRMSDWASVAAEAFCDQYTPASVTHDHIIQSCSLITQSRTFPAHTVAFTVTARRTRHRKIVCDRLRPRRAIDGRRTR
jgi:hypothetical protein